MKAVWTETKVLWATANLSLSATVSCLSLAVCKRSRSKSYAKRSNSSVGVTDQLATIDPACGSPIWPFTVDGRSTRTKRPMDVVFPTEADGQFLSIAGLIREQAPGTRCWYILLQ